MKQNSDHNLPREINAAIRIVIGTISSINSIYTDETLALTNIDTPKFLSLQEEKFSRAQLYHSHMSEMIARKDELKSSDPALRNKLKELQAKFHELSAQNLEALERMQRCTDKLALTIRNAAIRSVQNKRNYSYGMDGLINASQKNKVISSGLSETA